MVLWPFAEAKLQAASRSLCIYFYVNTFPPFFFFLLHFSHYIFGFFLDNFLRYVNGEVSEPKEGTSLQEEFCD